MGKPLSGYSQANFSLTVGVVLTEKTNAGGITVYELVSLGRHPYTGFFGQLKKRDHVIIEQSLEAAGIAHKANNYVSELSDGERQKAMIAKALAQQCPIILLDEPTASADAESEHAIQLALASLLTPERTIVVIAHRLSTIVGADQILVLDGGRIVEHGAHADLLAADGVYRRLWNAQDTATAGGLP